MLGMLFDLHDYLSLIANSNISLSPMYRPSFHEQYVS